MGKLTAEQVAAFETEGVLVAEDVLTDADLQPVIDEIDAWVDQRARTLKNEGKIDDMAEGEPFERRIALLAKQHRQADHGIDIMAMRGKAMFAFLRNANLLDVIESLLGPEITCNPIQHVRSKYPVEVTGEEPNYHHNVPWHQDAGVTWEEADPTNIITCWVPLVDATEENGCMQVLPGVTQLGQLEHEKAGGTQIVPAVLPDVEPRPVPCRKGGVVLMNKYTPHRSTPNRTNGIRWSVDLRYQPTGMPTGRPFHPEFVARSKADPSSELTDHAEWARRWIEALESSVGKDLHARAK